MIIELSTLIQISVSVVVIGGAVVSFFVMQKGQNMKIDQLQEEVKELKRKQSDNSHYQIETEKAIVEMSTKLDHILKSIEELKNRGV